jgi:hypothetical protein
MSADPFLARKNYIMKFAAYVCQYVRVAMVVSMAVEGVLYIQIARLYFN